MCCAEGDFSEQNIASDSSKLATVHGVLTPWVSLPSTEFFSLPLLTLFLRTHVIILGSTPNLYAEKEECLRFLSQRKKIIVRKQRYRKKKTL